MKLSPLSKKLIAVIALCTIVGLYWAAPSSEPANSPVSPVAVQPVTELDQATIKSLTNLTQHLHFNQGDQKLQYRGYVQGVGYSSYQFLAQKGDKFNITLEGPDPLEMILYGLTVVPLANQAEYVIPENGLYDLRVLYKIQAENREALQEGAPTEYRIEFTRQPFTPAQ